MKKIFLVLVVLGGLALWHPASRGRLLQALRPALNPVFVWSTKGELERIARDLEAETRGLNRALPPPAQFPGWLERKYEAGAGEDAWGSVYYLELFVDSFVVGSPGPDGARGTGDDLRVSRPLARSGRRP